MRANNERELTRSGLLWHPVLMSDSCWQGVVGAGTLSLPVLILCLCTVRQHSPVQGLLVCTQREILPAQYSSLSPYT